VRRPIETILAWLRSWLHVVADHRLLRWWRVSMLRVRHDRYVAQLTQNDLDGAQNAIRRVAEARLFPPDCVSAGAVRGGPALIFKHDGATEIFIGTSYDHAAGKLLQWFREERSAGEAPQTRKTTRLNRATRRAWASNKKKGQANG
jgi:hypothetical protein